MTEDSVLKTLQRIPDRIILAVATRDLELSDPYSCLCGWAIRESLAEMRGMAASDVPYDSYGPTTMECAEVFGGADREWTGIFSGVTRAESLPTIERAYVRRLDQACGFSS